MTKKFKTIVLSALYASTLYAGDTLGYTNDGVSLATDGTGDFLIAPFYEAKFDVCSEIKVFNTNETNSILAKVSIRERISSQEVDLPIFLSPGDVWAGTLCEVQGRVILRSEDDSNHPSVAKILSQGKDLTAHSMLSGHKDVDFRNGYVEIYPIAQFDEKSTNKVDKSVLIKRWDMLSESMMPAGNLLKDGVDEDSLSGVVSFVTNDKETASINMVAFENAHSKQKMGNSIAYAEDTSPEVLLGQKEKIEILKLLQNNTTSFVYDNFGHEQSLYITFPFGYTQDQERSFKLIVRDMSENKDIEKTVIFSPRPTKTKYSIKNELAIIPVNSLIALTSNTSSYKKGMIQVKEITNISNHQLGFGQYASFLPTLVSTMESREKFINSVVSTPVKK